MAMAIPRTREEVISWLRDFGGDDPVQNLVDVYAAKDHEMYAAVVKETKPDGSIGYKAWQLLPNDCYSHPDLFDSPKEALKNRIIGYGEFAVIKA